MPKTKKEQEEEKEDNQKRKKRVVSVDLSEMWVSKRSFGLRIGDDDTNSGQDLKNKMQK